MAGVRVSLHVSLGFAAWLLSGVGVWFRSSVFGYAWLGIVSAMIG